MTTPSPFEQAALLRLANTVRGTEFATGHVLAVSPDPAPGFGAARTIHVVRGGKVVSALTPEQVLHALPPVLLHVLRTHPAPVPA